MNRENFSNAENRTFYRDLPIGEMNAYIEASGLSLAPELDLIWGDLSSSPDILELGAAEGRVVAGLLSRGYSGIIYAVERDEMRCDFLRERFGNDRNVRVLQKDILLDELPNSHTGLLLWAAITEFNPDEQNRVIQKLSSCVSNRLIIDIPAKGSKTNATSCLGKYYEIEIPWGTVRGYLPSEAEIMASLKGTKFHLERVVQYKTSSDRERELYLLTKLITW